MSEHKLAYNQKTAKAWRWEPSWFGAVAFDDDLLLKVVAFQKANGLEADGLVGSGTFRRISTEREARISNWVPYLPATDIGGDYIIYNRNFFPIEWDNVIIWDEATGHKLPAGCYTDMSQTPTPRKITMGVTHWDVCLSSSSCFQVLSQRGVSVHFGIDNDGTIHQWLDMDHVGWHASDRDTNNLSVGVEISNAYYPKYQPWYEEHGFGLRPIVKGAQVHGGTLKPFLGFYPVQLEALSALWHAVANACNIPLQTPSAETVVPEVAEGIYEGFVHHYHVTRKKIDCAGLDLAEVLHGY